MHPSEVHQQSDSAWKEWGEKRSDRNKIVGQMVYVSEGIIAKTFNAHDEHSSESDGSCSSQAMEVDSLGLRSDDDSTYSSSEDSVRARKEEAAGDVSLQDKEQNEQTETGILSKEDKVLRNPGRLRPGSRAARTPRKRTQAGAETLLRLMKIPRRPLSKA